MVRASDGQTKERTVPKRRNIGEEILQGLRELNRCEFGRITVVAKGDDALAVPEVREMIDDELIGGIVDELRVMARAGASVPSMLRRIQQIVGRQDCRFVAIQSFRTAFDSGVAAVKPITGWYGFGSELSDEQVQNFVGPIVQEYMSSDGGKG